MAKATLKLDGHSLSLTAKMPAFDKLIEFLDSLPEDELLTANELVKRGICGSNTLTRHASILGSRRYLLGNRGYVYGNKKAILSVRQLAKKELEEL